MGPLVTVVLLAAYGALAYIVWRQFNMAQVAEHVGRLIVAFDERQSA